MRLHLLLYGICVFSPAFSSPSDDWFKKVAFSSSLNLGISTNSFLGSNTFIVNSAVPVSAVRLQLEKKGFYYVLNVGYGLGELNEYALTQIGSSYVNDYLHQARFSTFDFQPLGLGYKVNINSQWSCFFDYLPGVRKFDLRQYRIGNGNLLLFDYRNNFMSLALLGTDDPSLQQRIFALIQDRESRLLHSVSLGTELKLSQRYSLNFIVKHDRVRSPVWLPFNGEAYGFRLRRTGYLLGITFLFKFSK